MMKVGILSAVPMCGKTTLMELLAAVFTISQGRTAALFSTGDLSDLVNSVETIDPDTKAKPDIVRTMIETSPGDKLLLDYGTKIGMENVYLYDVLGAEMEEEDKIDFLTKAIDSVPVDLTVVEFTGDLTSEINRRLFQEMDCSLFLVYPCWKAISNYRRIWGQMPVCPAFHNTKTVAAMIDPKSIGDKKMATMLGVKVQDVMKFQENDLIPKEALAVHLDACAQKIVNGDPQWVMFRMPFYEIMHFIFDPPTGGSVIRPIEKWYH